MHHKLSLSAGGFLLGLLIMIALATVSLAYLRSSGQAAVKIAHIQDVSQSLVTLLSQVEQAEAQERSYLLSGQEQDLQSHQQAEQRIKEALSSLRQLTAQGRPQHRQWVRSLESLVNKRRGELDKGIQVRRERGQEAAVQVMLAQQDEHTTEQILRVGDELYRDETRLLGEQAQQSDRQSERLAIVTLCGTALAMLLVSLALWRAQRSQRRLATQSEQLRESEEKFRAVAENAKAVFGVVQGRHFVYVNPYLAEATGYSMAELLSMDLTQLVHPDFRAIVADRVRRRQMGEEVPSHYEFMMLTKSGQERWIDLSVGRIEYKGRPAVIGTGFDVTDRKRAEEQLQRSQRFLERVLETTPNLIYVYDLIERRAVYINRQVATILGYTAEQVQAMGADLAQIMVGPDGPRRALEMIKESGSVKEDQVREWETRVRTASGEWRWLHGQEMVFTRTPEGKPKEMLGTAEDVTERKRAEEALQQAKQTAESANQAKDQFLAVLSHELRTPLTPVLATVSLLETDQRLEDDLQQDMQLIRRNVELEARLIDDLLDLTRIVRGKLELRREAVDVHRVLERAMDICCQGDAVGKQLRVSRSLKAFQHQMWGDPVRLEQVFWNLLNNAVKFTPSPGQIDIRSCNPRPDRIRVEIRDTGVGIEPQVIGRIFDAFEQGHRSVTRQFGGLGLGLAITRRLVEMQGGTITAQSEGRGRGATFTVEFPLLAAAPSAAPRRPAGERPEKEAEPSHHLRILLVEDHADTARIMRQLLVLDGHEVQIAGDVASALDLARSRSFDLIISDLGLPDGSGLDVMRQLRSMQRSLTGIALSGFGRQEDIDRSHEAGFAEHLTKPVDLNHLSAAIARVMAVHGSPGEN